MTALKSQLASLAGTVPSGAPQSSLARYIVADLKGGEAKHNFTMQVIATAIVQAFRGNQRDIPEAVKVCAGKSVKARAYLAGFQAIANDVKPIPYTGKLDAASNAPVRDAIDSAARHAEFEFEAAYLAVMANAKIESAFNRKAKAKTAPAVAEVTEASAMPASDTPTATVDATVVDIGDAVDAVVDAIKLGMLDAGELVLLRAALAAHDTPTATEAFNAAMASAAPIRAMLNA